MGHAVGIICDKAASGEQCEAMLGEVERICALGIHRIPMSPTFGLGDFAPLGAVRKLVEHIAPDVLHGHGATGGAYARLMPRKPDRIALYTPHGDVLHYSWFTPAGASFLSLERLLGCRSDGILFESGFGARAYARKLGMPRCRARVVPNGLGSDDFLPLPLREPVYDAVFVGELCKLKGVATLIESAAELAAERRFNLALAGTGPDETYFRKLVAAKGLERCIHFLGYRPVREVFAKARMIVIPSLVESFPYVALEAAASGRPTVATSVGAMPDIFGPYGALVPPGNAAALAQAMRTTLNRFDLATVRAGVLKERTRRLFSSRRMARDVTRFYGEIGRAAAQRAHARRANVKGPETATT